MKRLITLVVFAVSVHWLPVAQAIPVLTIDAPLRVSSLRPFFVDIYISGLEGPTALGAFDLELSYTASKIEFVDLTFGDQLDLSGLGSINFFSEDPAPGVGAVDFFEVSLDSIFDLQTMQADSFLLARLEFDAIAFGAANLQVTMATLSDEFGNVLPFEPIVPVVVVVAEPATVALLGLGLIGLCSMRRRWRIHPAA